MRLLYHRFGAFALLAAVLLLFPLMGCVQAQPVTAATTTGGGFWASVKAADWSPVFEPLLGLFGILASLALGYLNLRILPKLSAKLGLNRETAESERNTKANDKIVNAAGRFALAHFTRARSLGVSMVDPQAIGATLEAVIGELRRNYAEGLADVGVTDLDSAYGREKLAHFVRTGLAIAQATLAPVASVEAMSRVSVDPMAAVDSMISRLGSKPAPIDPPVAPGAGGLAGRDTDGAYIPPLPDGLRDRPDKFGYGIGKPDGM